MPTTRGVGSSPLPPPALTPHQPHSAQQDEGQDSPSPCRASRYHQQPWNGLFKNRGAPYSREWLILSASR